MRRLVRAAGRRYRSAPGGQLDAPLRLRRALSAAEYRRLRRLAGGPVHLAFDAHAEVVDRVLLAAGDDDMELLIKCQRALRHDGEPEGDAAAASPLEPARPPRLSFAFEDDSRELGPFLASLRRNGFRAVSLEGGGAVTVIVEVHGTSDLEVVQAMALASSLRDLVARAAGHTLRGRPAGR